MRKTTKLAWISAMALAVFVVWLAADVSANAGVGFLYAVPIGFAAWWGGRWWGAVATAGCSALYVLGDAIQPVPHFGVALALRLLVFIGVVVLVSSIGERLIVLEHSAEEREDIQAALAPSRLLDVPDVDAAAAFVPSDHGVSGTSDPAELLTLTNAALIDRPAPSTSWSALPACAFRPIRRSCRGRWRATRRPFAYRACRTLTTQLERPKAT
jgi:hypothetical protein